MIVVADTSVILNLCRVQRGGLFQRLIARPPGISTIGVPEILLQANKTRAISAVNPIFFASERNAGFWISTTLRVEVLRLADEPVG